MDYQNRVGGKTGTGGVASASMANRDRRERLRQLALETIDLKKDPYFMTNHLGSYECKLCLTLHNNEGSYLAHTQGKKHQSNLARRAAKDAKDSNLLPQLVSKNRVDVKKFVKIGRPGYRITKQLDPANNQQSLLFQIDYPEIADNIVPRHRFMSAYEQKIEPPERHWQYVLFAAEPYETIAFKVPSREVDKSEGKFWTLWNKDSKQFFLQFAFRVEGSNANYSNVNSQNFISQNNLLNRLDKNANNDKNSVNNVSEQEKTANEEDLNNQVNEFNNELNNDKSNKGEGKNKEEKKDEVDREANQEHNNQEHHYLEDNPANYEDSNQEDFNYEGNDQQQDGQIFEDENLNDNNG